MISKFVYLRFVRRSTRLSFWSIIAFIVLFSLCDVLDNFFHLGWGYKMVDLIYAVGLLIFVIILYVTTQYIFRLVDDGG